MAKNSRSFTEQIRKLIDESGESRYRIALECGIDAALLSRFMHGKATFSMPTLDRLADYLGWEVKRVTPPKLRKTKRPKE